MFFHSTAYHWNFYYLFVFYSIVYPRTWEYSNEHQDKKYPFMMWSSGVESERVGSLGWEDPLEKGTAAHSSIFAWEILGTEEPGRLQAMGSESHK